MYPFMLYLPTRLIVGSGTINRIGMIATDTDKKKALIHYGSERMLKSGLIDRIVDLLSTAGMECVLLGGVVPNPRLSLVRQGIEICRKENVDLVLAVGGGSVIDSAKAISCGAMYDGDVWDFYSKGQKPPVGIRLGCILTIAAAGSEMSNTSVLTNEDGWIKMVCSHDHFRPTFAVLDPDLTLSIPKYQTACGCADIFLHTAERYLGGGQSSEVTDSMSEALLRTVVKNAEVLMKDPENKNARAEIIRQRLVDRVDLRLGNGLEPISEKCGMISVTGMGGRTIRDILLSGQSRLRGASLLLSAHTDWHLIRGALHEIGYSLDREEPCFAAGRYYLMLVARPGGAEMTDREIRLGGPLFRSASPVLIPFLRRRRDVLQEKLQGLCSASCPDRKQISLLTEDIGFLEACIIADR